MNFITNTNVAADEYFLITLPNDIAFTTTTPACSVVRRSSLLNVLFPHAANWRVLSHLRNND